MAHIFTGLFPRVLRVRIQGQITQKLSDSITSGLKNAFYVKPEAIMVTISSAGGSLTQAKNITDILKQYSLRNNVAIYTFAEDQCLGSANVILTSGYKCHSSGMSLIGDIGYLWSSLWFQKFSQKYNVQQEYVTAGENKIKFNPFDELKPESQKWMQDYLAQLQGDLKKTIMKNRSQHFTNRKLTSENIEESLFKKGIIPSQDAKKCGMIDEIANMDDVIAERFSGVKIHEINKANKFRKLRENMGKIGINLV